MTLLFLASPSMAQERLTYGSVKTTDGRWLAFSLPGDMKRADLSGRKYRDRYWQITFTVSALQPHPWEEVAASLKRLASASPEVVKRDPRVYHQLLLDCGDRLDRWRRSLPNAPSYELDGVKSQSRNEAAKATLKRVKEELLALDTVAFGPKTDYAALRKVGARELKVVEACLGNETDRLIFRTNTTEVGDFGRRHWGKLRSKREKWDDRTVEVLAQDWPGHVENVVFLTLDNQTVAFGFSLHHERKASLEPLMKQVVHSAHLLRREPHFPPAIQVTNRRGERDLSQGELTLLQAFGALLAVLFVMSAVGRTCDGAYDICRARKRMSVRESLRVFKVAITSTVVVGVFYVGFINARWKFLKGSLKLEELGAQTLVSISLLIVLCAAFAVIGARLGFHRSRTLCRVGSNLGLLAALAVCYYAVQFVMVG